NLQGLATNGPPLVTPVFAFDMTQLADGRVLAAGGVITTTSDNDDGPATDQAWILDGNTWAQLPVTLNFPRAHHRIIPLPNGNALVLGGAETGGGVFPNPTGAVVCPELFDAQTNVFVKLDPCTNSGSGAWPQWAMQEGDGLFVLSGSADDLTEGGDSYGFIAFTPEL
ncbi:MAG: hypothetical protein GWP91_17370, partial [Rhodobacterales bacterium]|nr:hypothetical protein [Rhodobacterales bacterium]